MFGNWLKKQRRAAGLKQDGLAKRMGVSRHTIIRLEKETDPPSRDTLRQLGKALEIDDETMDAVMGNLYRQQQMEWGSRVNDAPVLDPRLDALVTEMRSARGELTELQRLMRAQLDALAKIQRELRGLLPARERQRKTEEPLGAG